jgi:hypothetical protein
VFYRYFADAAHGSFLILLVARCVADNFQNARERGS